DLQERLQPLIDLGLGYLSLARSTPTLSGGELQRVRLATQLSSRLFGVVYVLDEPSAGLHPRDREALRGILQGLKRSGNSVFVVEHSLDVIAAADWLVDIGPGAGMDGGQILYSGPPPGLADVAESVTQRYLFGEDTRRTARTPRDRDDWLELAGVRRNNLHDISVAIPLRCLTAVTGVSGSGKSSLVAHALAEIVGDRLGRPVRFDDSGEDDLLAEAAPAASGEVVGDIHGIRRVVCIDQKPIGRTPRSNVATYTGVFDDIRRRFSQTPEAQAHGYKPGRFSFNVAGGRCPTCEGEGWVMVELLFLPSIYSPCPDCRGTRYNADTLAIRWRGRNIAEVLELSTSAAREFFDGEVDVLRALDALCDVGLGYLRLGQPATELSGGEAQRVKLAGELQRAHRSDTLYLLDEPTAGLHPADTDRLLAHLHRLVDAGNTVVAAELDMRVVAQADYVIDLGPGAGAAGGRIVVAGTPAEVAQCPDSATAPYLAVELAR
ncbi:MAG: excinuclease ABC subunit A, partial [Gordonia amarae]